MNELEKLQFKNIIPTHSVVVNDRSLLKKTKKSQLPYIIQALLLIVVPSKLELARLNKEFQESGERFLVFDVPITKSKYTGDSDLVLLSSYGYADVALLQTLFYILRLFYKQVHYAKKEKVEPSQYIKLTGTDLVKEFKLSRSGSAYARVIGNLRHLASTGFKVKIENTKAQNIGVKELFRESFNSSAYIKESIESIISIEIAGISDIHSEDATQIITKSKSVIMNIKLCDLLFNQLQNGHYRLIDMVVWGEKLKSDIAKVIYTYVIFHNQTNFKIGVRKLCSKTCIKYSQDPVRRKEARRILKKALAEIEEVTEKGISGEIIGDAIQFSFAKHSLNVPIPRSDFGSCPKCGVGRVIARKSSRTGMLYWFCDRGKGVCDYVSNNEPKRITERI